MATVWITDPHNLHCPTCDQLLVVEAGRFDPLERPDPVYSVVPGHACPDGHALPDDSALYAYRDGKGYPQERKPEEVWRPGG